MSHQMKLPPLNANENFYILAYASKSRPLVIDRRPPNTPPKSLSIQLEVDVIFQSDDVNSKKTLAGLSILINFDILIPYKSKLLLDTISNVLESRFVPFELKGAYYKERPMWNMPFSPEVKLTTRVALISQISLFLHKLVLDPMKMGHDKIRVELSIEKRIILPNNELEAWIAWYEEQDMACPLFEDDYKAAISKPRMEDDELDRGGSSSDMNSCSVCSEDLGGELRWMECSHVFHEECVEEWLKTSHLCPRCHPTAT